jgi:hypothetical protein
MINFLESWQQFLWERVEKVQQVEDIGYLYETFVSQDPALRKAGGVYYTPQYIVDEIVRQTIGKQIAGKTPKEIEHLSILDPSCGSGSFLLGAYQFLLDWYLNYYYQQRLANPTDRSLEKVLTPNNQLRTEEKKRILVQHLYGVDIDMQAVEVTKLSLALKAMEGETEATINTQLRIFKSKVLPNLDTNVVCGNSLIGHDFYEKDIFLTPKEQRKINTFDWKITFPKPIKRGGFDIVIGNPPYVQPTLVDKYSYEYISNHYHLKLDLYATFIEKSLSLLQSQGMLGYIVPSLFLKGVKYSILREFINNKAESFQVTEQGDKVFEDVKMPTCVFILKKGASKQNDFFYNTNQELFTKIATQTLGSISTIRRGLEIGRDKLQLSGEIKCITGRDLDNYYVKKESFITSSIYQSFRKEAEIFTSPKLLVRETGNRFFATIDYENVLTTRSIYNVKINHSSLKPEFILGIINSALFRFYFSSFIAPNTNIFPKIRIVQLSEIPIPILNLSDKQQQITHDNIVKYVAEILALKIQLKTIIIPSFQKSTADKILYYQNKIDILVYQLYQLTPEEIALIEGE